MSLFNFSFCRYLKEQSLRNQDHWDARCIVRAIKGDEFGGYANIKVGGSWRSLTSANKELAVEWFVEQVSTKLTFNKRSTYFLCPIPNGECTTTSDTVPRALGLAKALHARIPKLQIWDTLRWTEPIEKRVRDEDFLFERLTYTTEIPEGSVIILDDVCTKGAHARAAQRELERGGAEVNCALSVARTTLDPSEPVFQLYKDEL